jgi:hypothetical protein
MISLYRQDGETLYGIKEFILDSEDDVKDLPTHKKVHVGSTALVIPTGTLYMLNGSHEWVEVGGKGVVNPSPADCSCEEILNEIDANGNNIVDTVELNDF